MGAGCINISKAFESSTCKNGFGGVKNLWVAANDSINVKPAYPVPLETATDVSKVNDIRSKAAVWVTATDYTAGTLLSETAGSEVHSVDADYTSGATFAGDVTAGDLVVYGNTKFWKFPLPIDLGDYVEDVTADPKLGVSFVTITINGTLLGLDHDASAELSKIMQGKQMLVAELYTTVNVGTVETPNMKPVYVLLGESNAMDLTSGGSRSGAEAASLQGYELTWTGVEPHYARFLDSSKVDATKSVSAKGAYLTVVTDV